MVDTKSHTAEGRREVSEQEKWDAIRADYLSGEYSVTELAQKYGASESTIYKKASKDGWKKMQEKIRQKADEKYVAHAARIRAKELEVISGAAVKMAELLAKTVGELDEQPPDKRVKNLKGLSAVASAIQSNTDTLMKLYGIQTPAQEAAQKIARQRLSLDQRKQRMEEKREATSTQGQQVRYVVEVESVEPGEVGALDE
jgi:transposase-like protein